MIIRKDLGEALAIASSQPPSALKGHYEDDGSNLRVQLSKQGVVQIIKWGNRDELFAATLSDSVVYMNATISSAAAVNHQKRTGRQVTETLGNIIQIQNAEVVATHLGPRSSRITLFVSSFKVVGSGRSGQFGYPGPFEATSEYSQLLETLSTFRTSDATASRPWTAVQKELTPAGSRLGSPLPARDNRYGSQPLFSQIPIRSDPSDRCAAQSVESSIVGQPLVALKSSTTHKQSANGTTNPANQTAALMKMLTAKQTVKSIPKEGSGLPESGTKLPASLGDVASAQQIIASPKAEAISALQPESERSMLASLAGSSRIQHRELAPSKSKAKKIRSRDTKISNEQRKLLDREDSWLPAEPGRRGPVANVPITVLQAVTEKVEQRATEKSRQRPNFSELSPNQSEELTLHAGLDDRRDQQSDSPVPSADWPPSSPIPTRNELPPDSSVEMAGCSDDEEKAHPQSSDKSIVVEGASRSSEGLPSSRGESTTCLAKSIDSRPQGAVLSSSQMNSSRAVADPEHLSPALMSKTFSSATQPDSSDQVKSMAVVDQEASDSDSDIEMTVPLKLHDEDIADIELNSTQEIPATAFEPPEPFTQVKRTPYAIGREHQNVTQAEQQSSAPEIPSSPSKRRRIDDLGTAQRVVFNAFDDDVQAVSPKPSFHQGPLRSAGGPFQTQTSSIEGTILSQLAQQETLRPMSSAADRASNTSSPISDPAQLSEPTTDVTSRVVDSPIDRNVNLRRKFESPVLSPYVSKRRKMHKSPSTFKFTQDEYPKEDPSITARRYREEYFASRKNSRSKSRMSLHEVGPDDPSSSANGKFTGLAAPRDLKTTNQDVNSALGASYDSRDQPDVLRSSPIHNGSITRQDRPRHENNAGHTGERLDGSSCVVQSTPPNVDPIVSFPATDSTHQTSTQVPIVASVEQSSLLLAQSIQPNLHSVCTKLEGLSSTEISQQTDRSGQAQSLPELMTPAMSVAEIPQRTSPATRNPTTSLKTPPQPGIFSRFKATYPEYLGAEEHFVGMCRRIHQLLKADRMEHKSLWDDFIIRHKTDYPRYCQQCMDNAEDPKPYERFYREEIDEPSYNKRIIQPSTLGEVIPIDQAPLAAQGADLMATMVKLESSRAQVGAQSAASPDHQERSGPVRKPTSGLPEPVPARSSPSRHVSLNEYEQLPVERQPKYSPKRSTSSDRFALLDSRETVDLTGDQSSSPTPAPHSGLSVVQSERIGKRSPRKIPWQEHEPASKVGGNGDGRHESHGQGSSKGRTLHVHATDEPPTTTRPINNELAKSRSGTPKAQPLGPQAKALYQGPLSGQSSQSTTGTSTRSRIKGQKPTASSPSKSPRPEPPATAIDEWWKDDNTPFREYVRLYQSITPGKGNAWAKQKDKPRVKAAEEVEDKQRGSGREESPELGSMDVMTWRL
ncbi:MAG: hypothetical protein Q9196_002873 [Gyalolechia fulgens]